MADDNIDFGEDPSFVADGLGIRGPQGETGDDLDFNPDPNAYEYLPVVEDDDGAGGGRAQSCGPTGGDTTKSYVQVASFDSGLGRWVCNWVETTTC